MPTEQARLFFALVPDAVTREHIHHLQSTLGSPGRPVPLRNFHITLAFLGNVDRDQIELLLEIAATVELTPVDLALDQPGWFKRPQVGWLGPHEVPESLLAFQAELEKRLGKAGFDLDKRPWKPHLSLYRKMRMPFDTIHIEAIRWRVNSFSLVESKPVKGGVEYLELGRWNSAIE